METDEDGEKHYDYKKSIDYYVNIGEVNGFSFRRNGQWMARIRKERRGGRKGQYFRLR